MFTAGERVNLRFTTRRPLEARLTFEGHHYTIENGGLVPQWDGGLLVDVQVPNQPGEYDYVFQDGDKNEQGRLRALSPEPTAPRAVASPAESTQAPPDQGGGGVRIIR